MVKQTILSVYQWAFVLVPICEKCLEPVKLVCESIYLFYFIFTRQAYSTHDIYVVFLLSECVKSVSSAASGVPRELCAHDVLHKHTFMCACMSSHSSEAPIVTA